MVTKKSKSSNSAMCQPSDYDMSWQAPEDARALQRADEIRGDKQRMKHVTTHVQKLNKLITPSAKPAMKSRGKSK